VFGRVTKLGRAAADALARAIEGGRWDSFYAERCVDEMVVAAQGIPSLRPIASELAVLHASPLIAPFERDRALEATRDASRGPESTELDLILCRNAERFILRNEFELRPILEDAIRQMLERAVLAGRSGFMQMYGTSHVQEARTLLAPIVARAAAALERRPTAKRLGLARVHAKVTAETDLLGGT
jgi:hypothetical protein